MYANVWLVEISTIFKFYTDNTEYNSSDSNTVQDWSYSGTNEDGAKTRTKIEQTTDINTKITHENYIKGNKEIREKTDIDPNTDDNFIKILRRNSSAFAILRGDSDNRNSWLIKSLEKNDDTKNMVELTKFLIHKAINPEDESLTFDFEAYFASFSSMSSSNNAVSLGNYLRQFSHATGEAQKTSDGKYYIMYVDGEGWPTIGNADIQWKSHYKKFDQQGKVLQNGQEKTNNIMSYVNSYLSRGPVAKYSKAEVSAMNICIEVGIVDNIGDELVSIFYNEVANDTLGISLSNQQMYALTAIRYNFGHLPQRNGYTFKEVYQKAATKYEINSPEFNQFIWDNWWCYLGGGEAGHIPARDAAFETYVKGVYDFKESSAGTVFGRNYYIYYTQAQLNRFSYAPSKSITRTSANEREIFTYVENTSATGDSNANDYQKRIVEIAEAQLEAQFTLPKSSPNYIEPISGGYCQRFVRLVYQKAGAPAEGGATAIATGKAFGVSTDFSNIPAGASVFGNSPYSPKAGHVGIYDGKGGVINLIKKGGKGVVVRQSLNKFIQVYYGGCWGWQSKTPVNPAYPISPRPLM